MRIYIFIACILLFQSCNMKSESNQKSSELPEIDSFWDYNNPEETEVKFRALIPKVKDVDQNYYAELLTQLARTQSLQMKFDAAHSILDSIENMLDSKMIIPNIRCHLERGRTFNSNKEKERAIEQFNSAYQLSLDNNKDFYTVDAAHMIAIAEKPENQLKWNLIALKHSEESSDPKAKKWIGSLYNNIGWTYHDRKDFNSALTYFEKGLDFRKGKNDTIGIFIANWTIGRTYRSLNKIDEAISVQKKLAKQMEEEGLKLDGYVYEELGECFLIKNEIAESKQYFKLAYNLLSEDKWLATNEADRLDRMKKLGTK